jgi:hypothetical protein
MSSKLTPPKDKRAKHVALPESEFKRMAEELISLRKEKEFLHAQNEQYRHELEQLRSGQNQEKASNLILPAHLMKEVK